jgi:hypothetical protein
LPATTSAYFRINSSNNPEMLASREELLANRIGRLWLRLPRVRHSVGIQSAIIRADSRATPPFPLFVWFVCFVGQQIKFRVPGFAFWVEDFKTHCRSTDQSPAP